MEQYTLTTSDSEIVRLKNQGLVLYPSSQEFIHSFNIKPHWKCLEIACGVRGTLDIFYPFCAETGELVGLDLEEKFTTFAQKDLQQEGMSKIRFVTASATSIPFPDNYFDCIHARLFFLIYPHKDKTPVLKEIYRVCKPGGIIAFQESILNTEIEYYHPIYYEFNQLLNDYFLKTDMEIKMGLKLRHFLNVLKLENISITNHTPLIPYNHPSSSILIQVIQSIKEKLFALNMITPENLDVKIKTILEHIKNTQSFIAYPTIYQAKGTKPL